MPPSGSHLGIGTAPIVSSPNCQDSTVVCPVAQANHAQTAVAVARQATSSAARSRGGARSTNSVTRICAPVRSANARPRKALAAIDRRAKSSADGTWVPARRAPICTTTRVAISTMKNAASIPLAAYSNWSARLMGRTHRQGGSPAARHYEPADCGTSLR